ncbi:MAG TPA: enoyl-CoA hydratase/isomerase family protein [Roseiflexaceae bacterium]|jgi:enoyl-CoA hydratase/carnithine racemase
MNQSAVLLAYDGPLATITLNRPAVLNAMNMDWVAVLDVAVRAVAAVPDVRVVLVRGAGRAFCAGLDLNMYAREGMPPGFYELQERAFRRLELMDKITIAALHGHCLGGGVQLAIACDIRVCAADGRIGLPAINEGLFPGMAPLRLVQLIGLGPARRLILSGEVIGPDEALRLGLIDHLVPADGFDVGVADVVERYLAAPATAAMATKRMIRRALDTSFDAIYEESRQLLAECLASEEAAAARAAWRQRREAKGAGSEADRTAD